MDLMQNSTNPFERLPNEIVILIFTKLPHDLKFLMQCFLVSHQFASAILHVPSVKFPLPLGSWLTNYNDFEALKAQIIINKYFNVSSNLFSKTNNLLSKFLNLRSLHLVFPEYLQEPRDKFYYIKIKVEKDFYTTVYLQSDLPTGLNENRNYSVSKPFNAVNFYTVGMFWEELIDTFINDYLESIRISCPNSSERICIKGEELINLKMFKSGGQRQILKSGYIHLSALQLSRKVMRGVFLCAKRIGWESDKLPENWDDIKGWDYGEGEDDKVFEEAINSIVLNHKDKFTYIRGG